DVATSCACGSGPVEATEGLDTALCVECVELFEEMLRSEPDVEPNNVVNSRTPSGQETPQASNPDVA
ncbi:MAG: hypothetical protein M3256_18230, partial [Actinomycetota bacterium]|nr:hypothetical protein [Actinomycetota bacterium]